MHRFTVLSIVLLLGSCAAAPFSKSAAHVVVPANQLPGTLGQSGWSPTEEQIASCEASIAQALARKKHDLGSYHLRLGGVVRNGGRHIVGIAADKGVGAHYLQPVSEETIVLPVFGGGEAFFSFDYDLDRGKVVTLEFNAAL